MAQNEARPLMKLMLQPCRRWELAHVVRVEGKRFVSESQCVCVHALRVYMYTQTASSHSPWDPILSRKEVSAVEYHQTARDLTWG